MHFPTRRTAMAALAALGLLPALAGAQTFPDKPITFVVPFAAGTATDQIARALANGITAEPSRRW